jgi:hypothetical protein
MDDLKLGLRPIEISKSRIEYELCLYNKDNIASELRTILSGKIINLEDDFIKQSLISLGWAPPKDEMSKHIEKLKEN